MIKYELGESQYFKDIDRTLYRIIAVRDFGRVRSGDLGGWIAGAWNLSSQAGSGMMLAFTMMLLLNTTLLFATSLKFMGTHFSLILQPLATAHMFLAVPY